MVSGSRGNLMRRHKLKVPSLHWKYNKGRTSENMDLSGKPFKASDRKIIRKKNLDLADKNSWTQGLCKQQINMSLVNSNI